MKVFILIGVGIYFLSRAVLFMKQTPQLKTGIYYLFLMLAEIITVVVVIYQLFCNTLVCNFLISFHILGFVAFGFGVLISVLARFTLGSENWQTGRNVSRPKYLVTDGIYSWIRHPIYLGTWLMGVGFELSLSSWLLFIVVFLGFPFIWYCSYKEERYLLNWFGNEYQKYKEKTNWFFPIKQIKRLL